SLRVPNAKQLVVSDGLIRTECRAVKYWFAHLLIGGGSPFAVDRSAAHRTPWSAGDPASSFVEPVLCEFEPSLWHQNTDIENSRSETGARNGRHISENQEKDASETRDRHANW